MIEKYPELIKHFKSQTEEIKGTLSRTFFITTHNKEADNNSREKRNYIGSYASFKNISIKISKHFTFLSWKGHISSLLFPQ